MTSLIDAAFCIRWQRADFLSRLYLLHFLLRIGIKRDPGRVDSRLRGNDSNEGGGILGHGQSGP